MLARHRSSRESCLCAALVAAGCLHASPAAANFAPLARASASPEEAVIGQPIAFSSALTVDPDNGPQPLAFSWDFGDGGNAQEPNPTHAYTTPGTYDVTLVASDGLAMGLDTLTVFVLPSVAPGRAVRSSPIELSQDGARLFVVNPDADSVTAVDTAAGSVVAEAPVGARPRALALSPDGATLYVACERAGELWALDAGSLEVIATANVGHLPHGVIAAPDDGRVLVSNQGSDTLSVLEPGTLAPIATIAIAGGPRALAITPDGARLYVTHFLTRGLHGTVTVVNLATLAVEAEIPLIEDTAPDTTSSGSGYPNLLGAIAAHPGGQTVWVGGLKSNTDRGTFLSGAPLVATNRVRGLMARIDTATGAEDPPRRIDTNDADSASAIAFSPLGRYAYVAHQGAGSVSVYDLLVAEQHDSSDGSTVPIAGRIEVGDAPQGIAVAPDGSRLYVADILSRSVSIVDVTDAAMPVLAATIQVAAEPLAPEIALGKRLFFRSRRPEHSSEGYIACASCHPDGGMDGRTWDFTHGGEGLRNTIDLRGRGGTDHGPVHWSANFDEIQDFENDIVHQFGGTGLAADGAPPHPPLGDLPNAGRSPELDALAAYVASLREAPPRPPADPAQDGAIARGEALFQDPAVGCARCHAAPRFTDSVLTPDPADYTLHDVGTLGPGSGMRLGGPLSGLDTPTLIGLWDTAPYLHDGSAATLGEVLTTRNPGDQHGVTSHLTAAEIEDLAAYLLSIDRPGDAPIAGPGDPATLGGGCGCTLLGRGGSAARGAWMLALALGLVARRPRWRRKK